MFVLGALMTTPPLAQFREASRTEREKGNYFERLGASKVGALPDGGHRR